MFNLSLENFTALFNQKFPGVYRPITVEDVNDMTKCGLIGRYDLYLRGDLEIIRGILEYEQLRGNRLVPPTLEDIQEPPKCKKCNKSLPVESEVKIGRPRRYCLECEPLRNRDRQRKSSSLRKKRHIQASPTESTPSPKQLYCETRQ